MSTMETQNGKQMENKLKKAIFDLDLTQRYISEKSGLHETIISRIVNGWMVPTQNQKIKIAGAVGMPVDELFENRKMENL
jgi:transcriptional regulator with XRE-family HTH domain